MLLTLPQPSHHTDFGTRVLHDFKSPLHPASRLSSKTMNDQVRTNTLPASITPTMSTHHRGLPPPAGMTLSDPGRPPPAPQIPPSLNHPLGAMPEQPRYQSGADTDPMRNWLATKAEEEKRRQEEERTRQQSLKLEQRRIEHAMLQDSLHGQVPPHMVPMIFAGIGGANLANFSLEVLQQWQQQMLAAQQQLQQQHEPELRRETRSINQPPALYPLQAHQQVPPPPSGLPMQQPPPPPPPSMTTHQTTFSAYQPQRQPSPPQSRVPQQHNRAAAHSALPRLTTGDMQVHAPPTAPSSAHPLHQTQTIHQQDHQTSSPSIYFHHWVPPTSQTEKGNAPQTPVVGPGGASHLSEGEYSQSPRKRKNQAAHQAVPPPSGPSQTSPAFSAHSSSGKKAVQVHARSGSKSSRDGDTASVRATPSRRDSGAPHHGAQIDFVVNVAGGPPPPEQRRQQHPTSQPNMNLRDQHQHPQHSQNQHHHGQTAPSSPKREYR